MAERFLPLRSCGPPGGSAGQPRFPLTRPCSGRGLPDATISRAARGLLPHDFALTGGIQPPVVWFLWHFPGPFGPPGFPRRPAPAESGLSSSAPFTHHNTRAPAAARPALLSWAPKIHNITCQRRTSIKVRPSILLLPCPACYHYTRNSPRRRLQANGRSSHLRHPSP